MSLDGNNPDRELLTEIRDLLKPINIEHYHEFVIPVEWETTPSHFKLTNPKNGAGHQTPDKTTVTRLRCACGEEDARSGLEVEEQ